MGPYSEMVIGTRRDDGDTTDNDGWTIYSQIVVLLYSIIGIILACAVIVPMLQYVIGLICAVAFIGLATWACEYYGTDNSIFDRFRYRTLTPSQRTKIERRLSGHLIRRRLSDQRKESEKS